MTGMRAGVASVTLAIALATVRANAEESCVTCHPQSKSELQQSVHAAHFACTACHGGDAETVSVAAHAREKGYIGVPSRAAIPALCGSCHADAVRMRPFGLPTDQLAQYSSSEHGQALARGDERVAVCTDCHRAHDIVGGDEPTSPVARQNVPATCGRCHADAVLMASYGLPSDVVEKFRRSVHGVALFVDQHPVAPTCATCHGAHAAVAPRPGEPSACGHCHTRSEEYLQQGPHGAAGRAGTMAECTSCHRYHDVDHPTLALFENGCAGCHSAGSAAATRATVLASLLEQAEASVATATAELRDATRHAPTLVRYDARLRQGRAYVLEAGPVQHALDVDRVQDLARRARSINDDVRAAVSGARQERRLHVLWLALAWVYLVFVVAVAYLYRREVTRARRDGHDAPH